MTTRTELFERCREAARIDPELPEEPDSLIGFFQTFRPDGRGLEGLFDGVPSGDDLHRRLERLFEAAGDDRRPEGGRDAYFIVRRARLIGPKQVERLAQQWLEQLRLLASELDDRETARLLDRGPAVRVLEGIPPKHPKRPEEKVPLLVAFEERVPRLIERIEPKSDSADLLRQAYYFVHCDAMLRDFLMWPLYSHGVEIDDPFGPYFELWAHGIKYRIFQDSQIDFYMPRVFA